MSEVSVITTSMNYGCFLDMCIRSVMAQSHRLVSRVNHIVMDGGSKDDTSDILFEYRDRIRYAIVEGEGQTEALNHAMRIIEEEYPNTTHIGWINADDFYKDYWLKVMFEKLRKEPSDVALICSDTIHFEGPITSRTNWGIQQYFDKSFFAKLGNTVSQPSVLIRMSAFKALKEKYGFYWNPEYDYTQDMDLWYRFLDSGYRIRHLDKIMACLRLHPNQMSRWAHAEQSVERDRVMKKMCDDTNTPTPGWVG